MNGLDKKMIEFWEYQLTMTLCLTHQVSFQKLKMPCSVMRTTPWSFFFYYYYSVNVPFKIISAHMRRANQ